jgi:isoleucyl-tRNA synthetase
LEDYHVFRSLGFISSTPSSADIVCHVNASGTFTGEVAMAVGEAGSQLIGKEVLKEGSKAIVQLLDQLGVLVKLEKTKHRYPYDWKTNQPVIVTCVRTYWTQF